MQVRKDKDSPFRELYVKALDSLPVGIILEFPTTDSSQLPTGYMFCDGSAISRTTYSKLFEIIGTKFGSGDGSTTFNIPSKAGLVTAGIKSSDTDFDTIGETLGSKTVTLTPNNIGYHSYGNAGALGSQVGVHDHDSTYTAHNNIQPTQVSNFIIKVSETRALAGNIVNAYSESQNSAYSSDYCNKAFGGKVLWTNESPGSSFAGQAIPFSSTDIDIVEIYYTRFTGAKLFCAKVPYKNNNQSELVYSDYDNGARSWNRNITMTTTGITFGDCKINGTTTNTGLIPYKVIGYKSGLSI